MSEDEDTRQHPHNPYAPAPGDPVPNQYGQFTDQAVDSGDANQGGQNANSAYASQVGAGNVYANQAGQNPQANPSLQASPVAPPAYGPTPATPPTLNPGEVRSTHLGVRMMTPTHFDNQVLVSPEAAAEQAKAEEEEKQSPGRLALAIIPSVVALVCLVFGIWAVFMMMTKDSELTAAQQDLASKTAIIEEIERQTGNTLSNAGDVSAVAAVDGYIYIQGWGIKLKIPEELSQVSYVLNQSEPQTICFNAMQAGEAVPAYADIAQNRGGMGCLRRLSTELGEVDEAGNKYGEKVYSADGYNYFYLAPAGYFSWDEAAQREEGVVVRLIKEMVSGGNIGSY